MSVPLFDSLDELSGRIEAAPHLLVFCDFDGALAPVYDHPTTATLSEEVRPVLAELAESGRATVVVVSGRPAADVLARADVPGLIVAGNHGLEIVGPHWEYVDPEVTERIPAVSQLAAVLEQGLASIPGAGVEDKKLSVSVHYRQVPPELHEAVRSAIHSALSACCTMFVLTTGRMVFDIRPRVYWDKGAMVRWIAGQVGHADALPVFVGADPTDEEAFASLTDGITVRVGSGPETAAHYHVDGPDGVRQFLQWLRDQVAAARPA